MIPIASPQIGDEERNAVLDVLSSGQLAQGPVVEKFEHEFAAWCGVKHAVAVSSGTAALHLLMLAHGVNEFRVEPVGPGSRSHVNLLGGPRGAGPERLSR